MRADNNFCPIIHGFVRQIFLPGIVLRLVFIAEMEGYDKVINLFRRIFIISSNRGFLALKIPAVISFACI